MRTLIWFSYFWLSLIGLIPAMFRAKKLHEAGDYDARAAYVGPYVRGWMSALLKIAGVRVSVDGRAHIPQGAALFVGNHQGNFDIPLLLCGLDRPYGIVAKKELLRLPLVRIWMRYLGCVFLDRDSPRASAAALSEAAQNLRDGRSMIIFPEGTRSRSDLVGPFKSGAFRLAQKAGVPIVPICIDGSYRIMEANGMWIRPAEVRIKVLPPVALDGLSKQALHTLEEQVREQIIAEKAMQTA